MKDYLNYDGLAVMAHRGGSLEEQEITIDTYKSEVEFGTE